MTQAHKTQFSKHISSYSFSSQIKTLYFQDATRILDTTRTDSNFLYLIAN